MEKEFPAEPAPKEPAASESEKKEQKKKKPTAKTTAGGKKSTRKSTSRVKTTTVSKTAGPPKKDPPKKARVSPKAEIQAKVKKRKHIPRSKILKAPKPQKAAVLSSRFEKTDETLPTRIPEQPVEPIEPQESVMPPPQTVSVAIHAPTDELRGPDPLKKIIRYLGACFIVLIGLMIFTSYQNMGKYFITSRHGAVEIWKGKFSPKGRERLVIMPGVLPPEQIKSFYTREEVFPLAFQYYIAKADALREVPGLPDFVGIKAYLNRALSFATTDALRHIAIDRINHIDLMILIYKADVAASKGTVTGLDSAIKYLYQASALGPDDIQAKLINQKLESIQKLKAALNPKQPKSAPHPTKAEPAAPAEKSAK